MQASLCMGGEGDGGPVAVHQYLGQSTLSLVMDQPEQQQQDCTVLQEVNSCWQCCPHTLAQIQAFLLGLGLPLRKWQGYWKPHWLQFLKRPKLCGVCDLTKWNGLSKF